jgi:hypothetical protein
MDTLRKGMDGLMKKFKVEVVRGRAKLRTGRTVDQRHSLRAKNILICHRLLPRPPTHSRHRPARRGGLYRPAGAGEAARVAGGHRRRRDRLRVRLLLRLARRAGHRDRDAAGDLPAGGRGDLAKILRTELAKKNVTFHTGAKVLEITAGCGALQQGRQAGIGPPRDVVLVSTGRTCPTWQGSASRTRASTSTSAASRWTTAAPPMCPASGPSATARARPGWPTPPAAWAKSW